MATATLTFTPDTDAPRWVYRGRQRGRTGYIYASDNGDTVAAGFPITAATFGMSRLDQLDIHGLWADGAGTAPATAATVFEGAYYDKTAGTLQVVEGAGTAPFAESNTTGISAYTLRCTAWGA